jgi:hypothetical protein
MTGTFVFLRFTKDQVKEIAFILHIPNRFRYGIRYTPEDAFGSHSVPIVGPQTAQMLRRILQSRPRMAKHRVQRRLRSPRPTIHFKTRMVCRFPHPRAFRSILRTCPRCAALITVFDSIFAREFFFFCFATRLQSTRWTAARVRTFTVHDQKSARPDTYPRACKAVL